MLATGKMPVGPVGRDKGGAGAVDTSEKRLYHIGVGKDRSK